MKILLSTSSSRHGVRAKCDVLSDETRRSLCLREILHESVEINSVQYVDKLACTHTVFLQVH